MLYQIYKLELMAGLVYVIRHGRECCKCDNMSDGVVSDIQPSPCETFQFFRSIGKVIVKIGLM